MDTSAFSNPDAWLGLALLLALGAVVYFGALSLFTLWRLRHPQRRTYASAVARGIPGDPSELAPDPPAFEEWSFTNRGDPFGVWDVRGGAAAGPAVVLTHGWGASRIDMLARVRALHAHASRLVLWDMRAHGDTPGSCALGTREPADLAALIGRVVDDAGDAGGDAAAGAPLVLYGYSLGAEVSLRVLAMLEEGARQRLRGVVLEAPYARGVTPARAMLELAGFPWVVNLPVALAANSVLSGRSPGDRWADLSALASPLRERGTPLLVIHGADDTISPPDDGRAFARAGGGSVALVPGAGHADLFVPGEPTRPEIADALASFFSASA